MGTRGGETQETERESLTHVQKTEMGEVEGVQTLCICVHKYSTKCKGCETTVDWVFIFSAGSCSLTEDE